MSDDIQRYPSSLPFPFSRAVRAGGFLFLSGQVPMSPSGEVVRGDIQTQTEAVMARIGETLESCGARFDQLVKVTVWLSDMAHFAGFNEVYQRHVQGLAGTLDGDRRAGAGGRRGGRGAGVGRRGLSREGIGMQVG